MKSLTFAAGIATLILPFSAANAGILTIGEGFARSCDDSSEAQVATPATLNEDRGNIREAYADLQRARVLEPRWALPQEELQRYVVRE
jgi:hypothetical protein